MCPILSRRHWLLTTAVLLGSGHALAGSFEDFFTAIRRDDAAALSTLVRRGFDPNTVDEKGRPGIVLALQLESWKALEALRQTSGIDLNRPNAQGENVLMLAAIKGWLNLARSLIEQGADVNKTGWTPLHYAASGTESVQKDMVALLLEHHAYIDASSPNGSTPLMLAAQYGTREAALLLLQEGADPSIKNQLGLTAVQFAQRAERKDLAQQIAAAIRQRQPHPGQW